MPEFTLLPHARRREIMNQVVISLQLVTGLLLSVSTAVVPHLHTTCWSSPCLQKQLFWGQKFRDSRPSTSISYCKDQAGKLGQPGYGLGPAKQLLLTTFLKATCLGVTQVVQKFLTLQSDPMFFFVFCFVFNDSSSTCLKIRSMPILTASLFQRQGEVSYENETWKTWRAQDLLLLEFTSPERFLVSTCMHANLTNTGHASQEETGTNKDKTGPHFWSPAQGISSAAVNAKTRELFMDFQIETTFLHKTKRIAFPVLVKWETMVVKGHFYNPQFPTEKTWKDI